MSIGSIVNQSSPLTSLNPLTRRTGILPWPDRALRFCGLALAVAFLGACEQQVANAEQPPGNSALEKTERPEQDQAAPARDDRGKLVFEKAACELPNKGGEVTSDCSVIARMNPDRKGHLTYGPYLPLAAGEYVFEMEYRSSADEAAAAGGWDVAARLGPEERVIARGDILGTANKIRVLTGRFSMPSNQGGAPVLEIRAAPSLAAEAEIKRLRIYEVKSGG